jgi:RNA polymerase sigma-70 factor (ECF subfamily)
VDALVTTRGALERDLQEEVCDLYMEHARVLRTGLRRLTWSGCDVDDLLHEVFLVALRRPRALLGAESPKAWLFGVVIKVAAAARRKHQVRRFLGLDSAKDVASDHPTPLELEARIDAATTVERALSKLSRKKREVLVLFELEGLSGEEVATALGCPVPTVFTRLHHARSELERRMVRDD